LSEKDILMARFCDEQASAFGEVEVESQEGQGGVGKELADRVAGEGGDCCVPKKQSKKVEVGGC
jgi:4a-hydroxytetrahydrobiopterin dehydratase